MYLKFVNNYNFNKDTFYMITNVLYNDVIHDLFMHQLPLMNAHKYIDKHMYLLKLH